MTNRRQFTVQLTGMAALGAGLVPRAHAQSLDLARLLVGFPPGGSTDNVARRLAEKLRGTYAGNVIVENKPGAGTQIAVSTLKDAPSDGTSLLLSPPSPFSVYPYTYRKLPYSVEDVTAVSMVCAFPFALAVGPGVPESVVTLKDFIAWAKANPGKASFGSPAAGSPPHLVGSVLGKMAGFEFMHIAYRGDGPGLQDVMGGQIAAYSTVLGSYLPHMKSGRLRLLAVSGTERSSFAPNLPTYREQGYVLEMSEWFGVFVPAKTQAGVIQRAAEAVRIAVAQPDFVSGLAEFGMTARSSTPQELAARVRAEAQMWSAHVKSIGFTADT
jgi:tripartite-type tricarboxylate transporter receptor subunit TctC